MKIPAPLLCGLRRAAGFAGFALALNFAHAEFRDDFNAPIVQDPSAINGWNFATGDGTATMTFTADDGIASVRVDGTTDRRGIWWAYVQRNVAAQVDLAKVARPGTELRAEARIRSSHARKRVNLSFNTQRTKDYHLDLMEFDIAEANVWQTISFTTHDFDAKPGDHLNAQLALMDWGLGKYQVDIDYFKVDVVDPATAGPDLGVPVPYRPPVADPKSFRHAVPATQCATIDRREPDANLSDWAVIEDGKSTPIVTANGTQYVILRWDLSAFAGKKIAGSGLLEITTHSVQRAAERRKDFGMIRVTEIVGGDEKWEKNTVTYESLLHGGSYEDAINTQMIIDVDLNDARSQPTLITISRPVLQRILDGGTKGIILVALGSIDASFLPGDAAHPEFAPKLRFNLRD